MSKYKRGENVNPIDAKRKLEAQYKRQNEYNSKNYERVSLMLPFGEREKVRSAASAENMSLNAYIIEAIREKMGNIE